MEMYDDVCCYDMDDCCDTSSVMDRYFITTEEKIEWLGKYKDYLEKEAQGVKEAIEVLKK